MASFELNVDVNANDIFIVPFSELQDRLDPLFYNTVHGFSLAKSVYKVQKLSEVINMQRGRFGHRPRNDPKFYNGEYPFIQTGDIVKASQTNGRITYTQTLNELGLKTSRLFDKKVLVLTIAANIGDTAILDYPACFPDSLIAITPKPDVLSLSYLNVYFKFLKPYLNDIAPQSAQKNINYQQLSSVPIVVPPLAIQKKVSDLFHQAHEVKQQKEEQANELLGSIDGYLLNELGITLPEQGDRFEEHIVTVSFSDLAGRRLDPDYYKLSYQEIISQIKKSKFKLATLGEITSVLKSGKTPASFDYSETPTDYPIIKVGSYTQNFIDLEKTDFTINPQRLAAQKGDIFILSAAHQPEYVGRHIKYLNDDPDVDTSYVGELICVRVNQSCNSMFLFSVLMLEVFKVLINREKTGQTSHVYGKDIKSIQIPLPPIEKQNEIAAHISQIRAQAKQLQVEAAQLLANAKAEIERMILGDA